MLAASGRRVLVAVCLAFLSATEVHAGPISIIGDYPHLNDGTLSAVASLGGTVSKAVGFTMPGASYDLGSITLRLMEQAGSTNSLSVQLFGGVDNPTGPVLAQFNSPTIPNVASDVVFTPLAPFTLHANDTYWIYVAGTSNTLNGVVWYASTPGIPPSGVATAAGARFSNKGAGVASLSPSSVMNTFQVTGTPLLVLPLVIPEPASFIPAATSLIILLLVAARRKQLRRT